jgi:hypothetical protein
MECPTQEPNTLLVVTYRKECHATGSENTPASEMHLQQVFNKP